MVEIAEELVEAMVRGQEAVLVAQVVLAKLTGGIADRLESLRKGDVSILETDRSARHPNLRQAGPERGLSRDEGCAARGTTVLGVIVGEHHAFGGDAVDVRRLVTDQTVRIGAEV